MKNEQMIQLKKFWKTQVEWDLQLV